MPIGRGSDFADQISKRLAAIYQEAERQIAVKIAERLANGIELEEWQLAKLRQLGSLRREVATLTDRLLTDAGGQLDSALQTAYAAGGAEAEAELLSSARHGATASSLTAAQAAGVATGLANVRTALPGNQAVQRLAARLQGQLGPLGPRVVRASVDIYQKAIVQASAAPGVLLGTQTRRQATQAALNTLWSNGITGFTDSAGRNWNVANYAEMATRTTVNQALIEGHLDRLNALGVDLVIVSDAPLNCEKCGRWEGKVLTRNGPAYPHTVTVPSELDDSPTVVSVAGSVDEAISSGLMHPHCRHSLSAYLPGVTEPYEATDDKVGYAASQRQRELERRIRRDKLQAAGAVDEVAKARYLARVKTTEAELAEHVKANRSLGLRRKPEREAIDFGHTRPPAPRPTAAATTPYTVPGELRGADAFRNVPSSGMHGAPASELLTRAERQALGTYTNEGQRLAGVLRSKPLDYVPSRGSVLARMDSAMAKAQLDHDVQVWRGFSGPTDIKLPTGNAAGFRWVDKSFMSTSVDSQIGHQFATINEADRVVMQLHVPRGTRALALSDSESAAALRTEFQSADDVLSRFNPFRAQGEVLLDRGLTLEVVNDYGVVDGFRRLEVRVVGKALEDATKIAETAAKADRLAVLTQAERTQLADYVSAGPASELRMREAIARQDRYDLRRNLTDIAYQVESDIYNAPNTAVVLERLRIQRLTVAGRKLGGAPEIDELVTALRTRIEQHAGELDDVLLRDVQDLLDAQLARYGLERIGYAGDVMAFDRKTMQAIGGEGRTVTIGQPGVRYRDPFPDAVHAEGDGSIVLEKAKVYDANGAAVSVRAAKIESAVEVEAPTLDQIVAEQRAYRAAVKADVEREIERRELRAELAAARHEAGNARAIAKLEKQIAAIEEAAPPVRRTFHRIAQIEEQAAAERARLTELTQAEWNRALTAAEETEMRTLKSAIAAGDAEISRIIITELGPAFERNFGAFSTEVIGSEVQSSASARRLYVNGDILDTSTGKSVGRFTRYFQVDKYGELTVDHDFLELSKRVQGQGFAEAFNENAYDFYRASHVDRVELYANIDVGGYAWARKGFDFLDEQTARSVFEQIEGFVKRGGYPADARAEFAAMAERMKTASFGDLDYPTAYEMSQLGRRPGMNGTNARWLGKDAMLGLNWEGVMPL